MDYQLQKCTCGYGEGFYDYGIDSAHEYNPGVAESKATAKYHKDRNPLAQFFPHIDGRRVLLVIYLPSGEEKRIDFKYSKYGSEKKALDAAAEAAKIECSQLKLL